MDGKTIMKIESDLVNQIEKFQTYETKIKKILNFKDHHTLPSISTFAFQPDTFQCYKLMPVAQIKCTDRIQEKQTHQNQAYPTRRRRKDNK